MARNFGLRILRGLKANLPSLFQGELSATTDTNELYVGTSTGNVRLTLPVYNSSGTPQTNSHIVIDKVTIPGGGMATVSLTGPAAFTSSTSYICTAVDITAKNRSPQISQVSGSQITFTDNAGDVIQYHCIGV